MTAHNALRSAQNGPGRDETHEQAHRVVSPDGERTQGNVGVLTVGSLFSGIGGMELGLERAGMQVKWQVEIDPWCRKVLAKHWPDVPKYGDIKDVTELPYVDVIAGGFPCQPVSLAGQRRGQDDDRWLWPEFERIIRMVRPRYVLVENVPGLLTRGMSDVLGGLATSGYDAEWQVISAADVGAPHLRKRLWIVAYPNGRPLCRGEHDAGNGRTVPPQESQRVFRGGDGWKAVPNANGNQHEVSASAQRWPAAEVVLATPAGGGSRTPWQESSEPQGADRIGGSSQFGARDWWTIEPAVDRVAHGVPNRVDRLRGLGNAVVPQVVEYIGGLIQQHELQEAS